MTAHRRTPSAKPVLPIGGEATPRQAHPQEMCHFPALPVPLGLEVATTPAHECPYLPGRTAVSRGFRCEVVPGWAYQSLMDAGFRRSGRVFYQMACPGCRACEPIRVPVGAFRASRSQRRCWARNQDLVVSVAPPDLTAEKQALYARYLAVRHDRQMSGEPGELEDFLYRSPTETLEVCYRDPEGRLVGAGICDRTPTALSTVYCYFDPALGKRGLGIFSSLAEIRLARCLGLRHYYLGYWVRGCPKMEYKASFRPCELLGTDGRWRDFDAATTASRF